MIKQVRVWDRDFFTPGSVLKIVGFSDLTNYGFSGFYTFQYIDEDLMVVKGADKQLHYLYVQEAEERNFYIKVFVQVSIVSLI